MRQNRAKRLSYLLAMGLCTSLLFTAAHSFSGTGSTAPKEVREPITATTATKKSGILEWLESLLPDGIRLKGPAAELKNSEEVLATANCFDSGAGVSCNGFRNLEEYVAAVRVTESLGIPIQELQDKMQRGRTLSQAVQDLRPGVSGQIEALRAEQQARTMLRNFSS